VQGGTNWYAPSFSPITGLFYLTAWEDYPGVYYAWDQDYVAGKWFSAGSVRADLPAITRQEIRTLGPEAGYGTIRALDPASGRRVWEYKMNDVSDSGLLTTASGLLFSGNREGHFFALDAKDGKLLWDRYLGGQVASSPITWSVDGQQFVSIASGHAVFTFGLPGRGTQQGLIGSDRAVLVKRHRERQRALERISLQRRFADVNARARL
jgi:alcohol dehydrogenase (cytochrome c)